jgi:hypothetical protein
VHAHARTHTRAQEIGLLARLHEILPVFRAKIAAFKTRDKLVMGRLREALLNLKRFIKYKLGTAPRR